MSKTSFLSFHGMTPKKSSSSSSSFKPSSPLPENQLQSVETYHPTTEEIKKIFNKFDIDGDGKISLGEYKEALKVLDSAAAKVDHEAVQEAFGAVDVDGDGFIDLGEFSVAYSGDGGVTRREIQSAFRVFDTDGNGKISAEELMGVLRRMGEGCSLEVCRKMIKGVDKDGDDLIDIHEFITMMNLV
ncbi:calmodulin-like protein 30 [Andrographis paniculata]|uniref:calmodulin-like protein 30 n=1 Tax=Andrographis paniculata TaxID=175694 RepID=UPI0021E85CAF|nr:calmodulin-like protein 30 [Andrographis paniculata]